MKKMFRNIVMAVMAVVLAAAALPVTSVFAQGENPPAAGTVSNERLEKIWARQLKAYERLGNGFDDLDEQIAKFQERIDAAAEKGRDVTALQAALDAFEQASKETLPLYEDLEQIVDSHAGFDKDGKVTDAAQAKSTVDEMGAGLKGIKTSMDGTGKALREALKAFRGANRPPKGDA